MGRPIWDEVLMESRRNGTLLQHKYLIKNRFTVLGV